MRGERFAELGLIMLPETGRRARKAFRRFNVFSRRVIQSFTRWR